MTVSPEIQNSRSALYPVSSVSSSVNMRAPRSSVFKFFHSFIILHYMFMLHSPAVDLAGPFSIRLFISDGFQVSIS